MAAGISGWKKRRPAAISIATVVRRSSGWPDPGAGSTDFIDVQAPRAMRRAAVTSVSLAEGLPMCAGLTMPPVIDSWRLPCHPFRDAGPPNWGKTKWGMTCRCTNAYLEEIENRKTQGLKPKPIDDGDLVAELIAQIRDTGHAHRAASLDFLIYNTLPGTTSAAGVKATFLKEIILGEAVEEISPAFAFELLSHMKGGPSVEVLLDLALGDDAAIAADAADVLKTQVFLYEADTDRLKTAYAAGNAVAKDILESYSDAEFFTNLPDIDEEIKVVTYIAAEGDISTDLLSPGNQAHSRADRELHGKCMISEKAQRKSTR